MKKILIFFTFISGLICQTTIDTLSVTVYPEFSYPGVAIEYKFDKNSNDNFIFPVLRQIVKNIASFMKTFTCKINHFYM